MRLVALIVAATVVATAVTAALALLRPPDQVETTRAELRATPTIIPVHRGKVERWESFVGLNSGARGRALAVGSGSDGAVISDVAIARGQAVWEGRVVASVEGSPVVVLQGSLPAYRALAPKMSGPDVQQLHAAMVRLGLPCTCGDTLTKRELATIRWLVFRNATTTLDGSAWKAAIPTTGIAWTTHLPSEVLDVNWARGRPAKGPLARIGRATRRLEIHNVPAESRLDVGQRAIVESRNGRRQTGRVSRLWARGDSRSALITGVSLPASRKRAEVRVRTLAIKGRALLVPAAAVTSSASGIDRVLLQQDGRIVAVRVRVVADLGGTLALRGQGLQGVTEIVSPDSSVK